MTMIQEKLMERMESIWCRGTMGVYLNILLGWKSVWDIKMNGGPVDFYSSLDTVHLYCSPDWDTIHHQHHHHFRVEICHDRRDWRSCKICASCVNFSRKQNILLYNLHRSTRFTHTKCDFTLKYHILVHLHCYIVSKNSHNLRTFSV